MNGPLVLAIESATNAVGCAVGTRDGALAVAYSARGRRHAESLAPQIEFVMAQAGVDLHAVELVAVDVGPGLYTGLRVGVTTARALAETLGVKIVPVTSLEALAAAAGRGDHVVAVVDARRGEVFHAAFETGADGSVTGSDPAVAPPHDVAASIAAVPDAIVVGDGVIAHAEVFARHGLALSAGAPTHPLPTAVLAVACARVDAAVPPPAVEPMYLRRPDAVARWEAGS